MKTKKQEIDWDNINWSKSNIMLALQLGVSSSFIAKKRNLLGKAAAKRENHWAFRSKRGGAK